MKQSVFKKVMGILILFNLLMSTLTSAVVEESKKNEPPIKLTKINGSQEETGEKVSNPISQPNTKKFPLLSLGLSIF